MIQDINNVTDERILIDLRDNVHRWCEHSRPTNNANVYIVECNLDSLIEYVWDLYEEIRLLKLNQK